MAKIKKIKIYIHHKSFISTFFTPAKIKHKWNNFISKAVLESLYLIGLAVINTLHFFKTTLFKLCFGTGNIIFFALKKAYTTLKYDITSTIQNFPKRASLLVSKQFIRSLIIFLIIVSAGTLGLHSLNFVAKGVEIKNKILHTTFIGNMYLSNAKEALLKQDFSGAENDFAKAFTTFSKGQEQLEEADRGIIALLNLFPKKRDADRIIKAAGLVSQAGSQFISLEKDLNQISLSASGISAKDRPTTELFNNIQYNLEQILNKIAEAQIEVNGIDINNIPEQNRQNFELLRSQLNILKFSLKNFNEVFSLAKNLLIGDKNVLVLFQNNNELRASGGFIGTYGNMRIQNGKILNIEVSSVYDLDGQLTEIIKPPSPILNVNTRWYLRDSNWFADFPQSAKVISNFFEKEGGETPDLIIAMTPDLIIDWLKITGPVSLPNYGVVLTSDNFIEQTQVATTLNENAPVNSPKQILADLVPLLLQKLSEMDNSTWQQIIQSLQNNLSAKQIVIFAKEPALQSELQTFHWDGRILPSSRDYLSIISSNLGGTKSDLFIDQQNELKTIISPDGEIINELTITRTNRQPDLNGTQNTSFIRILVPKGSTLVNVSGFDYKNLDFPSDINYKIDRDAYNWERNSLKDVLSGTIIGQEAEKTFFGNWLTLKGGESRTIKISYKLPFRLENIDNYSLLAQKQIGQIPQKFVWNLSFEGRSVAWKNFDPITMETNKIFNDIVLDKDNFYGLVITK